MKHLVPSAPRLTHRASALLVTGLVVALPALASGTGPVPWDGTQDVLGTFMGEVYDFVGGPYAGKVGYLYRIWNRSGQPLSMSALPGRFDQPTLAILSAGASYSNGQASFQGRTTPYDTMFAGATEVLNPSPSTSLVDRPANFIVVVEPSIGVIVYTLSGRTATGDRAASVVRVVRVGPLSGGPVAVDDRYTVEEGASVLLDVRVNDSGASGASLSVTGPRAQVEAGQVRFRGEGCESPRQEIFSYTLTATTGATAQADVTVEVRDSTPPGAPGNIGLTASAPNRVRIAFDVPSENNRPDPCSPVVYGLLVESAGATRTTTVAAPAGAPQDRVSIDVDLAFGAAHRVELAAIDEGGLISPPARFEVDLRPQVELSPADPTFDFGPVLEGRSTSSSWRVANAGLVPTSVTVSGLSGPFSLPPPQTGASFSLAPGQAQDVVVSFMPLSPGVSQATLSIAAGGGSPLGVELRGEGLQAVFAEDDVFTVEAGRSANLDVLANDRPAGLRVAAVRGATVSVAASGAGILFEATGCRPQTVSFDYDAQDALGVTDSARATVRVIDTTPPSTPGAVSFVPGAPDEVDVSFVVPGDGGALTACAPARYRLRSRTTGGAWTEVSFTVQAPLGGSITQSFAVPWEREVELELIAVDEGGNGSLPASATLDLRRRPEVEGSLAHDFADVQVQTSETHTYTLRNRSIVPIDVRLVRAPSPPFALASGALPLQVGPGSSLPLTVSFNPIVLASSSGDLVIEAGGWTLTFTFVGRGVAAQVAFDDSFEVEESGSTGLDVLANDVANARVVSVTGAGGAVGEAGANVIFTSTACRGGSASLGYIAEVPGGAQSGARVELTLRDTAAPGEVSDLELRRTTGSGVELGFRAPSENGQNDACPPSGYRVTFWVGTSSAGPGNVVTLFDSVPPGQLVTARLPLARQGSYLIEVIAFDEGGLESAPVTTSTSFVSNRPPVITSNPPSSVREGEALTYRVTASDPDPNDEVRFELTRSPRDASLTAEGVLSFTPAADQVGTTAFTIRARDTSGAEDIQSFLLQVTDVNSPPRLSPPARGIAVVEGQRLTVQLRARDPDGDTLTFSGSGPSGLTVSAEGAVAWTPGFGDQGRASVRATVQDPGGLSDSLSFEVEVVDANRPPRITSTPPLEATQGEVFSYAIQAVDPDQASGLVFRLREGPSLVERRPDGTLDTRPDMLVSAAGLVTWRPGPDRFGTHPVTVEVVDAAGATDRQSFALRVLNANDPPVFLTQPSTVAFELRPYVYAPQVRDPDPSDALTFTLETSPSGMRVEPRTGVVSFIPRAGQAGLHAVTLVVTDDGGASVRQSYSLEVIGRGEFDCAQQPSQARCRAVLWTHAIAPDTAPVEGVQVELVDPSGARQTLLSAEETALIGASSAAGAIRLELAALGRVPVRGRRVLIAERTVWVPVPRMAALERVETVLSGVERVLEDVDGRGSLTVPAQTLSSPVEVRATYLDGQSLPTFLPPGYSPAGAIYLEMDGLLVRAPRARFVLPEALPTGVTQVVVARFDAAFDGWRVEGVASVSARLEVDVELSQPGGWAVLVPDAGVTAPPAATVGSWLVGTATTAIGPELAAEGEVTPAIQTASRVASEVTGRAEVRVTNPSPLPSGLILPARLFETYVEAGGRRAEAPSLDLGVAVYRYPPVEGAMLSGQFDLRPRRLFDPSDVVDVEQRVEVVRALDLAATTLDAGEGFVVDDRVALIAPAGAFSSPTVVSVRSVPASGLEAEGQRADAAFEVQWAGRAAALGLQVAVTEPLRPAQAYVLARQVVGEGRRGWAPVERMETDARGVLSSIEASYAARLPGLRRPGTHALFSHDGPLEVVAGTAVRSGSPVPGVLVASLGRDWLDETDDAGGFFLVATPGPVRVEAEDERTFERAFVEASVSAGRAATGLTLALAAPRLFVRGTAPEPGLPIPLLSTFEVELSLPLDPSALGPSAITLTATSGAAIPGELRLADGGHRLRFFPASPLAPARTHRLALDPNLRALSGQVLGAVVPIDYTTVWIPAGGSRTPELYTYGPGETRTPCHGYIPSMVPPDYDPTGTSLPLPGFDPSNRSHSCVIGGVGIAEPGSSVMVVNDTAGNVTTVIAAPNGAFKTYIEADRRDRVSAVLRNLNGTNTVVPLVRQLFDDGTVALYEGGGSVRGDSGFSAGRVDLEVESGSTPGRVEIRIHAFTSTAALQARLVPPPIEADLVAVVDLEMDATLSAPAELILPVDPSELPLRPGERAEDLNFVLARTSSVSLDGDTVVGFEVVDTMAYAEGVLRTNSPPFPGLLSKGAYVIFLRSFARLRLGAIPLTGTVSACRRPDSSTWLGCDPEENPDSSEPLPGAIVTAADGLGERMFRIRQGSIVSRTDASGWYALSVPNNPDSTAIARHPFYSGTATPFRQREAESYARRGNAPGGGVIRRQDFLFGGPPISELLPLLTVWVDPGEAQPFSPTPAQPNPRPEQVARLVGTGTVSTGAVVLTAELDTVNSRSLRPGGGGIGQADCREHARRSTSSRITLEVVSAEPALCVFRVVATSDNGAITRRANLVFESATPQTNGGSPEPGEPGGVSIVATYPRPGGSLPPGSGLWIRFDRPIEPPPRAAFTLGAEDATVAVLREDQRTVDLGFQNLTPGMSFILEVDHQVRSVRGRVPFDHNPTQAGDQPFRLEFETDNASRIGQRPAAFVRMGAQFLGRFVYHPEYLVQDSSNSNPDYIEVSTTEGDFVCRFLYRPGYPRSLLTIANYSYFRPLPQDEEGVSAGECLPSEELGEVTTADGSFSGCTGRNRDLLVVAGGYPRGPLDDAMQIRVYDVSDLSASECLPPVIAGQSIGEGDSVVNRLEWHPPHLTFLEHLSFGLRNQVGVVHLQDLIFLDGLSAHQIQDRLHPGEPRVGEDVNGDGDYLDPNERLGLPAGPLNLQRTRAVWPLGAPARVLRGVVLGVDATLRDYTYSFVDNYLGVVATAGRPIPGGGEGAPTQEVGPFFHSIIDPATGNYLSFEEGAVELPRQVDGVSSVDVLTLELNVPLIGSACKEAAFVGTRTVRRPLKVAVVGASSGDGDTLYFIEIGDVACPKLLNPTGLVLESNDRISSVRQEVPGHLTVRTLAETLTLSVLGLALHNSDLEPPIVAVNDQQNESLFSSNGSDDFGVTTRRGPGGERILEFSGPRWSAFALADGQDRQVFLQVEDPNAILEALALTQPRDILPLAQDRTSPSQTRNTDATLSATYIRIRAPGIEGERIPLLVEVLDRVGAPVRSQLPGYAPFVAGPEATLSDLGLGGDVGFEPVEVVARRASNRVSSDLYNTFISDPILLVGEKLEAERYDALLREGLVVLHSGDRLRVSIAPTVESQRLSRFASQVESGFLVVGSHMELDSFSRLGASGPNPSPLAGALRLPGTMGMIAAHSGEVQLDAVDFELPSPRMSLIVERAYRGQSASVGPLGPGWCMSFDEKLVPVKFGYLLGNTGVLIERTGAESTVVRDGDLVLHTGDCHEIAFHHDPDFDASLDPLLEELGWAGAAQRWYTPQPGVFSIIAEFRDGTFARLDATGRQYWYLPEGHLSAIYDRFTDNRHVFIYQGGRLRRVEDRTLENETRSIELSYALPFNDPYRLAGFDVDPDRPIEAGRVRRMRDFTRRDVELSYDRFGRLEIERGIEVTLVSQGGTTGRRELHYEWDDDEGSIALVRAGSNSDPLLRVDSFNTTSVSGGTHGGDSFQVQLSSDNRSDVVGNRTTVITLSDASRHSVTFDAYGAPAELTSSDGEVSSLPETTTYSYIYGSLLSSLRSPGGSTHTTTFPFLTDDTAPHRSRANPSEMIRSAGPAGGGALSTSILSYDLRYNLPSGGRTVNGRTQTLTLRSDGREIEVVSVGTDEARMTYDDDYGDLLGSVDLDGNVTEYVPDGQTRFVTLETAGLGVSSVATTYEYSTCGDYAQQLGWVCTETRGTEPGTTFVYDQKGRTILVSRGVERTRVGFNLYGYPEQVSTAGDRVEIYDYDVDGFLRSVEVTGTGVNWTTTYSRGRLGRPLTITNPSRRRTTLLYDHQGRVRTETEGQVIREYAYDGSGNLLETRLNGTLVERNRYDGLDRLTNVQHGSGSSVDFNYNAVTGDLDVTTYTPPGGASAAQPAVVVDTTLRDDRGRVLERVVGPNRTGYLYEGLRTTVSGPAGQVVTMRTTSGLFQSQESSLPRGRVVSLVDVPARRSDGLELERTVTESGRNFGQIFGYDDRGNVNLVSSPSGFWTTEYFYRPDNLVERVVNQASGEINYDYDAEGRRTSVQQADGTTTEMSYDAEGRLESVGTEPQGISQAERRYVYDRSSPRLERIEWEDGRTLGLTNYNPVNQPETMNLPGGGTVQLSYDSAGQVISRTTSVPGSPGEVETYAYDAFGRVRVSTAPRNVRFEVLLDTQGLPRGFVFQVGAERYESDGQNEATGARFVLPYPSGPMAMYQRDGGRLESLNAGSRVAEMTSYIMARAPETIRLGSGSASLTRVDTHDERRLLTRREYRRSSTVVAGLAYTYDSANRVVLKQELHRNRFDVVEYDGGRRLRRVNRLAIPASEVCNTVVAQAEVQGSGMATIRGESTAPNCLTSSQVGGWAVVVGSDSFFGGAYERTYGFASYDQLSSVTTQGMGPPMAAGLTVGTANRLSAVDGTNLTYDSWGNRTTVPSPAGPLQLEYDGQQRLRQVTRTQDGAIITYAYRGDGLLYDREVACPTAVPTCRAHQTRYVYDEKANLLQVYDLAGTTPNLTAQYFYADEAEVPIAVDLLSPIGLQRYYFIADHAGSLMGLMTEQGQVIEWVDYDPYGHPTFWNAGRTRTLPRSAFGNVLLFQSHLWDEDAQLYHMRARAYDPYTGQFLQRDPSGYADSVNLYAGFANDPVNNRDPTGRCTNNRGCFNPLYNLRKGFQQLCNFVKRGIEEARPVVEEAGEVILFILRPSELDYALAGTGLGISLLDGPAPGPADAAGAGYFVVGAVGGRVHRVAEKVHDLAAASISSCKVPGLKEAIEDGTLRVVALGEGVLERLPAYHQHHLFMNGKSPLLGGRTWKSFWKERGIDVDQWVVHISEEFHDDIHAGKGVLKNSGGWWEMELFNSVRALEVGGRKLTAVEAIEMMEDLMDRFGMAGLVVYRYSE